MQWLEKNRKSEKTAQKIPTPQVLAWGWVLYSDAASAAGACVRLWWRGGGEYGRRNAAALCFPPEREQGLLVCWRRFGGRKCEGGCNATRRACRQVQIHHASHSSAAISPLRSRFKTSRRRKRYTHRRGAFHRAPTWIPIAMTARRQQCLLAIN